MQSTEFSLSSPAYKTIGSVSTALGQSEAVLRRSSQSETEFPDTDLRESVQWATRVVGKFKKS